MKRLSPALLLTSYLLLGVPWSATAAGPTGPFVLVDANDSEIGGVYLFRNEALVVVSTAVGDGVLSVLTSSDPVPVLERFRTEAIYYDGGACSGNAYSRSSNPTATGRQLVVSADKIRRNVWELDVTSPTNVTILSQLPAPADGSDGVCIPSGGNLILYPLSATPVATVDQYLAPFRIQEATPPAMAAVPALNGPLGFVLAGALAGYWLALRRLRRSPSNTRG